MNLKAIIKAQKSPPEMSKWNTGHIPRSAFPLSRVKDKDYKFGSAYRWKTVKFDCLGRRCRVLLLLNEEKEIFRARFGVEEHGDMVVLCDYEFHATEPGWHCHFTAKSVDDVGVGAARYGKRKRPRAEDPTSGFNVTEANALSIAASRFGFAAQGDLF